MSYRITESQFRNVVRQELRKATNHHALSEARRNLGTGIPAAVLRRSVEKAVDALGCYDCTVHKALEFEDGTEVNIETPNTVRGEVAVFFSVEGYVELFPTNETFYPNARIGTSDFVWELSDKLDPIL